MICRRGQCQCGSNPNVGVINKSESINAVECVLLHRKSISNWCCSSSSELCLQQCNSSVRRPVAPGTGSPNQSKCELQSEGKRNWISPNARPIAEQQQFANSDCSVSSTVQWQNSSIMRRLILFLIARTPLPLASLCRWDAACLLVLIVSEEQSVRQL